MFISYVNLCFGDKCLFVMEIYSLFPPPFSPTFNGLLQHAGGRKSKVEKEKMERRKENGRKEGGESR